MHSKHNKCTYISQFDHSIYHQTKWTRTLPLLSPFLLAYIHIRNFYYFCYEWINKSFISGNRCTEEFWMFLFLLIKVCILRLVKILYSLLGLLYIIRFGRKLDKVARNYIRLIMTLIVQLVTVLKVDLKHRARTQKRVTLQFIVTTKSDNILIDATLNRSI